MLPLSSNFCHKLQRLPFEIDSKSFSVSYPHFPLTKVCYWLSTFFWSSELSSVSWLQWMIQKKHCWKDPFHIINYLNTFQADKENTPSGQNKFCLALKLPFHLQNKVLTSLCRLFKEVIILSPPFFSFWPTCFFLFGFYTLLCDNWKDAEWLQTPGSSTFKVGVSLFPTKTLWVK